MAHSFFYFSSVLKLLVRLIKYYLANLNSSGINLSYQISKIKYFTIKQYFHNSESIS